MQKKILIISLLGMLVLPAIGLAATCDLSQPPSDTNCNQPGPTTGAGFVASIQKILNLFFWVLVIVSVVFIMIAAFNFITAQGDPTKSGSAMNAVRNAAIGIIIAILAKGLAVFVATFSF